MRTPAGFYFCWRLFVTYNKPTLSIDKQVEHLLSCGMILPDIEQTQRDLAFL